MNKIHNIILRYFYLGNSKYAPGTVSSFFILIVEKELFVNDKKIIITKKNFN